MATRTLTGSRAAGFEIDVAWATSFDQYGAVRKRLAASPADAVVVEPASIATATLILKSLQGRTGLVLLNAWDTAFEPYLADWGSGLPAGTITQPQSVIGQIQGRQLSAAMPEGANVLVVTGPPRSSAARDRLEGLRSSVRSDITLHSTEANQWSETDGILAFNTWYAVFKSRREEIHAIAGQSDDLAVGAWKGGRAVANPEHSRMFGRARLFGVGACPGYGKEMVDDGRLTASLASDPDAKIDPFLADRLSGGGRDSFLVLFDASDDLDRALARARGTAGVYDALRARARAEQAGARLWLAGLGLRYKPLWIVNGLQVEGDLALARALASRSEVVRVVADPAVRGLSLADATEAAGTDGLEWGLLAIKADQVWNELGITGEGAVVMSNDTGVQWNHPALINQYRGWSGATADHEYNWFDATGTKSLCGFRWRPARKRSGREEWGPVVS